MRRGARGFLIISLVVVMPPTAAVAQLTIITAVSSKVTASVVAASAGQ